MSICIWAVLVFSSSMSVDILGNLFDFYFEMKNMSPFTGYWNLGCFLRVQHGYSAAINGFDFENVCSKVYF